MRRHWLPGPNWTDFFGRVIANGEDKIQFGGTRFRELIPVFAAQTLRRELRNFELSELLGEHAPLHDFPHYMPQTLEIPFCSLWLRP